MAHMSAEAIEMHNKKMEQRKLEKEVGQQFSVFTKIFICKIGSLNYKTDKNDKFSRLFSINICGCFKVILEIPKTHSYLVTS